MKKSEFILMRAERMHNAIMNSSFEFPGKAETLDVLAKIKDPLSLLEAITKLRSGNAIVGLICDDLRDLDQTVLHMEFDPETAPATKKRQPKSVELPTVANSATVEPAKTEPAKTEPAKTEPAKETVAIIDEPAAAKGSDPLDFDFADDPKPAAEPAKTEPAKTEPAKTEPTKTEPAKTEPTKTEPAKTEPAKTEPATKAPEADDTALKAVTVDDIRALAIKAAKAGKMAAVTTYLKAAGVPKVQDLDPSKFADFMAAMHKAGV